MTLPDISDYYTGQRAVDEEVNWLMGEAHQKQADTILPWLRQYEVASIVEYGCGSGGFAQKLPDGLDYTGIDKNSYFLERAKSKAKDNRRRRFIQGDVRNTGPSSVGCACCWAFLKHFGLHEWNEIVGRILAPAQFGCLEVQIADRDVDNGSQYHHVFVTEERLKQAIEAAGHKEIDRKVMEEFDVPADGFRAKCVAVWTSRQPSANEGMEPDLDGGVEEPDAPEPDFNDTPLEVVENPFTQLVVDGSVIAALYDYSLRWYGDGKPSLYYRGKRITKPWRLDLHADVPEDKDGSAA